MHTKQKKKYLYVSLKIINNMSFKNVYTAKVYLKNGDIDPITNVSAASVTALE